MTRARDNYINYLKERIKFYEGRGRNRDLVAQELRLALAKVEALTKW